MNTLIDNLLKLVDSHIISIFLKKGHSTFVIPITNIPELVSKKFHSGVVDTKITLWNVMTNKPFTFNKNEVYSIQYNANNSIEDYKDKKGLDNMLMEYYKDYKDYSYLLNNIDNIDTFFLYEVSIHQRLCLCFFDLVLKDTLYEENPPCLKKCQDKWLSLIELRRVEVLDILESEISKSKDLPIEDLELLKSTLINESYVDTIRSIKTIKDLVCYWPSELLPCTYPVLSSIL